MVEDGEAEIVWDAALEDETIKLAYEAAEPLQELYSDWADAAAQQGDRDLRNCIGDPRRGPRPLHKPTTSGWPLYFWKGAAGCCGRRRCPVLPGIQADHLRIGPDPNKLLLQDWLKLSPGQLRYYRLRDMGQSYLFNRDKLDEKAGYLGYALVLTAAEVACLGLAVLPTPRVSHPS